MSSGKTITILSVIIALLAGVASGTGIWSAVKEGPYVHESIRGAKIPIYGKGLYRHMSAEVAPQGIAQDYCTLFIGIPLLILSLLFYRQGSLRGKYLLAGTLAYFLVTYLFYLTMAMYNQLFLFYVLLTGCSFFAFVLALFSFDVINLQEFFRSTRHLKWTGGFLVFNAICISLLWLSIVIPPLLDGTIIPAQTEHYTTLIVQGLDLSILLPSAFISGILYFRKKSWGFLLAPVYFVFLSLLMTALSAKIVAMFILGYNVVPAIYIIPLFNITAIACTVIILSNIKVKADLLETPNI